MFLNPGIIYKDNIKQCYVLGNKEYTSLREFLLALPMCHTVVANLIIDGKVLPSGIVTFSEVNGYIIANVDTQFNFGVIKSIRDLKVQLYNASDIGEIKNTIIQSENVVNEMIDDCDTDADIYFKVGSIIVGNTNICDVPESFFLSLHTNNIPVTDFDNLSNFVTTPDEDNNQEENNNFIAFGRWSPSAYEGDGPAISITADKEYVGYHVIFSGNNDAVVLKITDSNGNEEGTTNSVDFSGYENINLANFNNSQLGDPSKTVSQFITIDQTSIDKEAWNSWVDGETSDQIVVQLNQAEAPEQSSQE